MAQNEEPLRTFINLGLTYLQAKIYLTLVKLGVGGGGVRQISRESNIARQDIYRILPALQKLGLVQKIIASPTLYRATSIETGFSMLLKQKTEEYDEMQKKATAMFSNFMVKNNPKVGTPEETTEFTITTGRNLLFKTLGKTVLKAQTSMDVICAIEGIKLMLFYALPHMKKATGRGVKIRIITEEAGKELIEKNLTDLKNLMSPDFQLRYVSGKISVGMALFDNKDASICVSDQIVPSLWTTNVNVLTLARTYFEGIWAKSEKIEAAANAESHAVELATK